MPVVGIDRGGVNSDQDLIVVGNRLFDFLQFEISHSIVAVNNGFHRIGWRGGLAAVIGRSPVGDEQKKECEDQQDKDETNNPF